MQILCDLPTRTTVAFSVCDTRPAADLMAQLSMRFPDLGNMYLTGRHGLDLNTALHSLHPWVTLKGRLVGGKGGFGSLLRSQGSKMSKDTPANYDSCRDLYGRRLRTVKQAKEIIENAARDEKAREEAREKRKRKIEKALEERPAKVHRFEDVDYSRSCEEIVEKTKRVTKRALREKSKEAEVKAPVVPLFDGDLDEISSESSSESESEEA
ncbi:hypothetical protein EC988_002747 [Linderina pennispora]|nr:hypothetical protein EC988_002747 [Linderina pennispora]